MIISQQQSLLDFNSFALDVKAHTLVTLASESDLDDFTYQPDSPHFILAGGSNLLFCEDFNGVLIKPDFKGKTVVDDGDDWLITVGAGENWHEFVTWCLANGYHGLENLALIPGCVGATPVQNIGAYGVEVKDFIDSVRSYRLADGEWQTLSHQACQFAYRDSVFKHEYKNTHLIVEVVFRLPKQWLRTLSYGDLKQLPEAASAQQIYDLVCQVRSEKLPDPSTLGNAGSFFKNPEVPAAQAQALAIAYPELPIYDTGAENIKKLAAGWLIDQCGLKGRQVGGAKVHQKQALVLVNQGGATPKDVIELAWLVRNQVAERFGVLLEHEVRFIAADGETTLDDIMLQLERDAIDVEQEA
ncbi:UDP-N-acetylmuramate dehydrogenase [Motilimonas sp. 1_MG-2023]|uniref:UDP-N-acetylmuramate dehydrogenase n=1 Tax=Motilimonas TaxID=1914248 RepID=UPI0026E33FA3|nr:UDP-N-acetylmuramate dehydrogenase [Motilimonas sp. 1_MG-2023]MDO6524916.1 UDP-N-acetylmuramate dehydrogenase [Motilimonas sp. 1_MG-2023]